MNPVIRKRDGRAEMADGSDRCARTEDRILYYRHPSLCLYPWVIIIALSSPTF